MLLHLILGNPHRVRSWFLDPRLKILNLEFSADAGLSPIKSDGGTEHVTLYYSVKFICHFSAYWHNLPLICPGHFDISGVELGRGGSY